MLDMLKGRLGVAVGIVVLAGVVAAVVLDLTDDDPADAPPAKPSSGVVVTWDGSEGNPSCAYDAASKTVLAKLTVDGTATKDETLTVTVSAYADENTSDLVGSVSKLVYADRGEVHQEVEVTIPVERPPHRGEDGETACRLRVDETP